MKDKANYARKGIAGPRGLVLQYREGVLFVAPNPSRAPHKISENLRPDRVRRGGPLRPATEFTTPDPSLGLRVPGARIGRGGHRRG
jgi:hypothetical protein